MKLLQGIVDKTMEFFSLFLFAAILLLIPLKILSYGWSPNYSNLLSAVIIKNNEIPISKDVIKESINSNSSIYNNVKENTLITVVLVGFIVFNLIGLWASKQKIAWFAAMAFLMLFNNNFILRLLNGSPQLILCILLITLKALFSVSLGKTPKTSAIAIIIYVFMLRFIFPPNIYSMTEMNISYKYIWSLPLNDLKPILNENMWLIMLPFIFWLSSYKQKTKFLRELDDYLLFDILFFQLIINLGYIDLALFRDSLILLWLSDKFSKIIELTACFKELRVKYSMGLFVILVFSLLATHDGLGRYSKQAIETMPIDFSLEKLKDWKPGENGIIFNDDVNFAFSQYCFNPNSDYTYIYINSFSLFEKERENILNIKRMLNKKITPLPDYYEDWVKQMKPSDRLVTSAKINGLENIEWLRCGRKYWIGRLKN